MRPDDKPQKVAFMSKPIMLDVTLKRSVVALIAQARATKAAVRIEQSQPDVSQALGKVRLYFRTSF